MEAGMVVPGDERLDEVDLAAWPDLSASELQARAGAQGMPGLLVPLSGEAEPQGELLLQMEAAVAALYPAWLPAADGIVSPGGAGRAAVQSLVRAEAARSDLFGPYLLAMADHALQKARGPVDGQFAPETRLRECHKLFCRAYGVARAALIIDLAPDMSSHSLAQVQRAALFIAAQNGFRVWLTGAGLDHLDRIAKRATKRLAGSAAAPVLPIPSQPHFPPLAGKPHPWSETEQRLEAFLQRCDWARGRAWNARWSDGPLSNPVSVDLIWKAERLVVEFDGPDHLAPEKYLRDCQRDRALQAAGFVVLRFTNEEMAADLAARASEIERFVTRARVERG
jgi:hypothetical protein